MKASSRASIALAAFATLSILPLLPAARPPLPMGAHPSEQTGPYGQRFGLGASRAVVLDQLGLPGAVCGSEYWIYWNFSPSQPAAAVPGDTLVIGFVDGKLASMRLHEERPIRALLAARAATLARAQTAQAGSNGSIKPKTAPAALAEAARAPSSTQSALVGPTARR